MASGIVGFEIALKSPIVGKTEREQGAGGCLRLERNDIAAVICVSDPRQRLTRDRVKIGELNRIANSRPDLCVLFNPVHCPEGLPCKFAPDVYVERTGSDMSLQLRNFSRPSARRSVVRTASAALRTIAEKGCRRRA